MLAVNPFEGDFFSRSRTEVFGRYGQVADSMSKLDHLHLYRRVGVPFPLPF